MKIDFKYFFALIFMFILLQPLCAESIHIISKNTLAVVELNHGDEVMYELKSGRIVHLKVIDSKTEVIFSTIPLPGNGAPDDASIFRMDCILEIDGQQMKMTRYAPVQESFYKPYIVSGLQIWFDALKSLYQYYNENHGDCLPKKQVRLALNDKTQPICPENIGRWCPLPINFPDVRSCYRGDDTWLGPYYGTDLHGGLDFNMPKNSPLWAPFSLDNNYYFNTTSAGNNNRWRAIKHWENGDTWVIQTHHLDQLLVPELQSVAKGTKYAYSGGTRAGSYTHTHFLFKTIQPGHEEYYMDPWVIFWQMLENQKTASRKLKAEIKPLPPQKTGEKVQFDATGSHPGLTDNILSFYWSFGDGGFSILEKPSHIYRQAGIYPVTLTIFDGSNYDVTTHHLIVNGDPIALPELRIVEENNPSFNNRQVWETDAYDYENVMIPNTVYFLRPHNNNEPIPSRTITVNFLNEKGFSNHRYRERIEPFYIHGQDWLDVKVGEHSLSGQSMTIEIKPDVSKLNTQEGESIAYLIINDNNFINSPQVVRIVVKFARPTIGERIIIDNQDAGCIKSNYFWLTTKLDRPWCKTQGDSFLLGAGHSENGYVRYYPNLTEGKYKVSLFSPLFEQEVILKNIQGFYVNIKNDNGIETKWINPNENLLIGTFDFPACDGYVEIASKGSKGLVVVDAIIFEKVL